MPRKSKKSEGPKRAFDATLLPQNYTLTDLERAVGINRANTEASDTTEIVPAIVIPGEDERALPPLLPEHAAIAVPGDDPDVHRLWHLVHRVYSTATYGIEHSLSNQSQRNLVGAFDKECFAVQGIVQNIMGGMEGILPHDRIEFVRQFTGLCRQLTQALQTWLTNKTIDADTLSQLQQAHLDQLSLLGFFIRIDTETSRTQHKQLTELLASRRPENRAVASTDMADYVVFSEEYHRADYRGKTMKFNKTQAKIMRILAEGKPVDEKTLGAAVGTFSKNYRLIDSFRSHGKTHHAYTLLIKKVDSGVYTLTGPAKVQ